jgi:predicted DNA-binding transcriptional regulator AlpA
MEAKTMKVLTAQQVADICGFSLSALAHLRSKRRGPRFYKVGRKILYRADDIERWLFQNPVETNSSHWEGQ